MDATLKGLVGLTAAGDVEARCAALVALAHLAADEESVAHAVGAALEAKNAVVRDFAVAYFERVRPRGGVGYLLPLLDAQDDVLRLRAVTILATYGQAAIAAAKKLLVDAPRRRLNAVIDLAGRVRTIAALDLLFDFMAGDDFDGNRAACDALLAAIPTLDARGRDDLFARAQKLLTASAPRSALIAAAKLFGALADPRARRALFPLLASQQPQAVRTHALAALGQCLRGQKLAAAEIAALLPLLDESDESGILRPAIQLLETQTLDRSYLPQLNRLADSSQPLVKRFAVQQLGGFESAPVVKTLIGYLTDDSYARRDQAAASLKKLPAARSALMKELLACEDERQAWTLADVLLAHDRHWKRDTLDALWHRLQHALEERPDRLYTAYFHLLNALDPATLAAQIRGRAERLRKSKDYPSSAKWLALLRDSPAFDAEAKFALAVTELKVHPRLVSAGTPRHGGTLDLLRDLSRSAFEVAARLRKERTLTPDELFYVAFHLAEGGHEERAVAAELLAHLAGKHGRTKTGKAARNKLRLLGGPQ